MNNYQTNSACSNEQILRRSLRTDTRRLDRRDAAKLLLELNPGQTTAILDRLFLTTATDIASMGCFLGLATLLIL